MDIFAAKVIDVQESEKYNGIVCLGTRYDRGLGKDVETSVTIGVAKEHLHLLREYKSLIGSTAYIPVNILKTANGIFRITAQDGIPLNLIEG